MNAIESICRAMRHAPGLARAKWLWDSLCPLYEAFLRATIGRRGLRRNINGTDPIHISVACRHCSSSYEPEVWARVMAAIRRGDVVVDVGAHIGLYSTALARRVGPSGRVVAFEPDPRNADALAEHARLNDVSDRVQVRREAVGAVSGEAWFASNGIESSIVSEGTGLHVPVVTLDGALPHTAVAILKVDVEGFEESVLRGAFGILTSSERRPRAIFLEVHPFAWHRTGTTSRSLLDCVASVGYEPWTLAGAPVEQLDEWCEIIATPAGTGGVNNVCAHS